MSVIKIKRGTKSNIETKKAQLATYEIVFATDTNELGVKGNDGNVKWQGSSNIDLSEYLKLTGGTIENTNIPLTLRRKNNSAGIYAGMIMERALASGSSVPTPYGIGGYFKAANSANTMTHAGLFGGRLSTITSGNEIGEVIFSPSWKGVDPYRRADLRIRATGTNTADVHLRGDFYANSTDTGSTGNKLATENYVTNTINTAIASVMTYKGTKPKYSDLPTSGNVKGDFWNVTDTGINYAWDGSNWDKIGGVTDLSGLVPTTRKVNDKALNADISLTANDVGAIPGLIQNKNVIGTQTSVYNISDKKVWFTEGALFYGSALNAGLVTRGVSGVTTEGSSKDHLYLNYDGDNSYSRKVVLGAGSVGNSLGNGLHTNTAARGDAVAAYVTNKISNKVDQVSGKGLSTNDYTTAEKNKLSGIETGAKKNVQSDWDATSGDAFIKNKPDLNSLIKTSYANLVSLKNNNNLVEGAFYRITDYETTTTQPNTRSAGHLFDIVIQAISESELAEVGTTIEREGENYFANAGAKLGAWQVWYDINNDTERYEWADEATGKGVIYRMIDEHMNDLPYDFKNIQFKRMFDSRGTEFIDRWSLNGSGVDRYLYTFNVIDENNDDNDNTVIAFKNDENSWNMSRHNKIEFNTTDNWNSVNKVKYQLGQSVFIYDYDLYGYWEFYGFYSNTIGNDFYSNTIGNDFSSNTIGNYFRNNTIGNYFRYNTIGNYFLSNTIGIDFYYNTIGNYFSNNTIGNYFRYNAIGNDFRYNAIGNYFYYNVADNNVKYISLATNGTNSNKIQNLYLKNSLIGTSSANRLNLYFSGLYGRNYNTTFEIIGNGNIVATWQDSPLSFTGKVKATKTTSSWSDI